MEGFFALGAFGIIIAIVWTLLCLILFFKIWGMTNDINTIKNCLIHIADKLDSIDDNRGNQSEASEYLEEGDMVVNIETGEELIVDQVFPDGDVTCKKSNGFGLRKVVKRSNLKKIDNSDS